MLGLFLKQVRRVTLTVRQARLSVASAPCEIQIEKGDEEEEKNVLLWTAK